MTIHLNEMTENKSCAKPESGIKILTDIEIGQCPTWSSNTDLFRSSAKAGLINRLGHLYRYCQDYDVVIIANIKLAQMFGFLKTVLRRKKPVLIILELMLDESRDSILWKIKKFFQRVCFYSAEVIFVSSKREVATYAERLALPQSRIRFLPFHTNVTEPKIIREAGTYIFSAGRTGRDYATLAAAVDGLDVNVVVVSDRNNVRGITFPENVQVLCDIPYSQYMELLCGSRLVVVPLKRRLKSTGQVVFLEAMGLGKPVIATLTVGTEDYIEDGVTGVLVPPSDPLALRDAIRNFLLDPKTYESMAEKAAAQIKERHTFEVYTRTILSEAERVLQAR